MRVQEQDASTSNSTFRHLVAALLLVFVVATAQAQSLERDTIVPVKTPASAGVTQESAQKKPTKVDNQPTKVESDSLIDAPMERTGNIPKAQMRRERRAIDTTAARQDGDNGVLEQQSQRTDLTPQRTDLRQRVRQDSVAEAADTVGTDSVSEALRRHVEVQAMLSPDSLGDLADTPQVPARWIPDPKKAMWLAIVFPGGGQIYNRKYWKLPIIYGGFLGCAYAITWNNNMYRDYSQAYIDIMDDDPNTKSYETFLPPSFNATANVERLKKLFKRKKDYYRRYRDLSVFCVIGVYALSIIDAYVDAELSSFDISRDLSMKVRPSVINSRSVAQRACPSLGNSYGVQCSLNF